ncbi:hypothetical protein BT96DRAFT_43582 [Gymnopus androsaceus JB14]|uniref:Uncharacterized protein n=1 Tax=Gymnopus androsaceus JB14 TaxID=1447944 RepID=A0A6A4GD67_9AGAR|nr:hypothetical protein BT96DRAFT_43582 [Gymnopus androsaceus JB14]
MKKGAQMRRHDDTHRSACDIISELLKNNPITLKIQTEIVYENKNLLDTEAGNTLNLEYAEQIRRNMEEIEELKEALKNTHAHETETIAEIQRELEKVRKEKESAENEKLALNASNEQLKKDAAARGGC